MFKAIRKNSGSYRIAKTVYSLRLMTNRIRDLLFILLALNAILDTNKLVVRLQFHNHSTFRRSKDATFLF